MNVLLRQPSCRLHQLHWVLCWMLLHVVHGQLDEEVGDVQANGYQAIPAAV